MELGLGAFLHFLDWRNRERLEVSAFGRPGVWLGIVQTRLMTMDLLMEERSFRLRETGKGTTCQQKMSEEKRSLSNDSHLLFHLQLEAWFRGV